MRATSSVVLLLAVAGCTAIDDFGKFTVGGGADLGSACTPGCTCVPGTPALGVPDHCALAASNNITCSASQRSADVLTLAAGAYTLDAGATPPVLTDAAGARLMTGSLEGPGAVFCFGSLVADGGARISIVGNRPVALIADSLVRLTGGGFSIAGEYAIDGGAGHGVAGGTDGGGSGNAGSGAGAGHAGTGSPGTGGGGGGSQSPGGLGGAAGSGTMTAGGAGSMTPLVGFGGGAGGKGASFGGGGGGGAGALQISAGWAIQFDQVEINAAGGGGGGGGSIGTSTGGQAGGGGGGGAGGVITLESPTVGINGGCISVVGGPGGGGGAAIPGGNAHPTMGCGFLGTAGVAPPMGGPGAQPGSQNPNGSAGTGAGGGGGGVGGIGRVTVRSHNPPPATQAPGVVPAQSYAPVMLP